MYVYDVGLSESFGETIKYKWTGFFAVLRIVIMIEILQNSIQDTAFVQNG